MRSRLLLSLLAPLVAIAFALGLAAVVLLAVDVDPVEAVGSMLDFAAQPASVVSILNRAIPLYISAIAVAVGFKMNLFNIGVEGQYLLAAVIAAWVGAQFSIWAPLHVLAILLVAAAIGAGYSGIAGVLRVRRGVSEVISTIMLNFIAVGLTAWLLSEHFRERIPGDLNIKTPEIPATGWIPNANWLLEIFGLRPPNNSELQGFIFGAALLGVIYYLLVWRTRFGYELRASGISASAARVAGVESGRMIVRAMLISGAFAGLVGMSPLLGFFHQYTGTFPVQLGFNGIAVALLGRNHPVGMALGAVLFGFLERSSQILDLEGIPKEIVTIITGVIVLAVVVAYEVVSRVVQRRTIQAAARAAEARPVPQEAAV
ncbi:MAG: ABC transporter permease [Acidimicrobiia bacterium]|nr:MAG: ABC transporter permease [Acidimicrobiia bacterium]